MHMYIYTHQASVREMRLGGYGVEVKVSIVMYCKGGARRCV